MDAHTPGKHIVLRSYLNAWLPILGTWNGRIIFIDGFAGPGEYATGEEGSPVIALKALLEHSAKAKISAEVVFVFIEGDAARAKNLEKVLEPYAQTLPPSVTLEVTCGTCAPTLNQLLDELEQSRSKLAPALVMLDPFGVKDTPLTIVSRLLKQSRCELFISFMWESMNRFKSTPEFEQHLDGLFGSPNWREALSIGNTEVRKYFLHDLYRKQLLSAGAKYVTFFELWKEGKHVYSIFFATQHSTGFDKMKEAIWRADRTGSYQFRGNRGEQIALALAEADLTPFQEQLVNEFQGKGWVTVDQIIEWSKGDGTIFYSGQVKRSLRAMEAAGTIEVDTSTRKRSGTHPSGTKLRIAE